MTAPAGGRDDATIRGAVVLVVAIVIGLALLARTGGGGSDEAATTTAAAATESTAFDGSTTAPQTTAGPINSASTTTSAPGATDTRPPGEVSVLVLNGTTANVDGIAGDNESKITAAGYTSAGATGADADLTTTTIYAPADLQADAEAIKAVLGIPDAAIEEPPAESPGPGSDQADIVVVIGDDAAGG
ncbi:LytR C-terminal domain-containing protein [Iamia majanohamensis]|uniref:LytR C-terminal domain-containing protein n=1 Tax=Iamia majanohamensis TaxID=467976 RepID=A0AAF0BS64_9ACTN|nr:LytR C-terminal domain-containing protein [Iamia majanohamensis]WCO67791.1 LytR C-terminal domain-containing protein [Iamia majanohamensis]